MTWANEGKSHNGEPKKSELLPTGEKAKEIVEVLVAMYRAMHNLEDAHDDDSNEPNQRRDAGPEKEAGGTNQIRG